jgi:hypothetical protein
MDDPNLAAEAALARLVLDGDAVGRAVPVVQRAVRVTDEMAARFREIQTDRAEQVLVSLPAGPIQWWLKFAIAKDDAAAAAELRDVALKTLPPLAQLAAMMELARRVSDLASLQRAAELQNAPGTWAGQYEFERTDKRLALARLASEMDPNLALAPYRDAAFDIPTKWHEEARHDYALKVFEDLAETRFEADKQTLRKLFELLQTAYSRSRTIMRVKGTEAVIASIADSVEAHVSSAVTELLVKARDAGDAATAWACRWRAVQPVRHLL